MKLLKKISTVILCMCLFTCSVNAAYEVDTTGSYGENGSWFWEKSTGTMHLEAEYDEEEIVSYTTTNTPWNNFKDEILRVDIFINSVGDYTFYNCTNMETVYFNRAVSYISDTAFEGCNSIKEVITDFDSQVIKDFAQKLGATYTVNPPNIARAELADNVTVGKVVYKVKENKSATVVGISSKKVKRITIPKKVTLNGEKYTVEKISKNAFKNCKKLRKITIKSTAIKNIGKNAFKGCRKLKAIYVKKNCYNKYTELLRIRKGNRKVIKKLAGL